MDRLEAIKQLTELHAAYIKMRDGVDRKRLSDAGKASNKLWYQNRLDAIAFAVRALGGGRLEG